MKAIFDHNGFTSMGDVPDNPPKTYAIPIMPKNNITSPLTLTAADLILPTVKIWNFELHDVTSVDGERIAIYKFSGES